ncbi:heme ABC exporter ATP-binding protein CcmA [Sneathiella chinensis]|uniref:Cytochrome c biogenesis ATP-binding export protein CcmA n=1 Tax=Sneathiella chinensis TaxID=349750 RepID=A0ABQ5U6N7_9PROT|nr:heme ABC exporter ATP-binding protein CcmA [Sneathiella chinensis]GLQ07815.1 cytochrome c biogenesis ATP-binding export protein CcmA [Sneathiella chinensis]
MFASAPLTMSLTATDLTCIRGDRLVFDKAALSLSAGQALWVKGKNGAGKTSLLRVVAGLLKPARGSVCWNGIDIREDPDAYQGHCHYIGHQDALKPVLTARENLTFWSTYAGVSRVAEALEIFELSRIADMPAGILSAGQKKRTNLARLVASPAPLWILDEPISSLDTHYIRLFADCLAAHLKDGGMALFATHQDLQVDGVGYLDLNGGGTRE